MDDEDRLIDVFKIGEQTFPNRLREDLHINQGALSAVFAEHAEKFAWYATAYDLALDHESHLKHELERVYAQCDYLARAQAKEAGIKMTEKMVENTVITDLKYTKVQEKYLEAKRNTGLLKSARDAMIHRRDMLIQMGANYRAEGASDLSLREQQYKQNNR